MKRPFAELERHPRLLAEVEAAGTDAATVLRLRRRWPAELVHAAVDLVTARRKAKAKFGEHSAKLLADAAGVEQASSLDVARHKAKRFAAAGAEGVVDLCCGIGGDAMALAEVAPVVAVDGVFQRAWMTRHNVAAITGRPCPTAAADVTTLRLAGRFFHLDPDRRRKSAGGGTQRRHEYDQLEPGPAFIERLLSEARGGAVKLGPGVELDALPSEAASGETEIELIQRGSALVQAVLWAGPLVQHGGGRRTATKLPEGASFTGEPNRMPSVDQPRRYLLAIESAIERAGLIGTLCDELGLAVIHPALGLMTSDDPVPSPWLTPFELLAVMPWRLAKVKAWLKAHDAGIVEVKTRGGAVEPDSVQKKLRGTGDQPYTVHVLRMERRILCYITRRTAEGTAHAKPR